MNRKFSLSTFSVVVFFILLFVYSRFGLGIPISVTTQQKGEPFVVSAEGKALGVPDIAKITVGIEEHAVNLKDAQDSVNKKSKEITDVIKKLGVGDKDIKTVSYNIYPDYNYREAASSAYETGSSQIIGYRVTTAYEIKIKKFEVINDVIVKSTQAGANLLNNIALDINEETKNKLIQEAREEAVKKAKEKAEGLARAAGIRLGKVINISEGGSFEPKPIVYLGRGGNQEIQKADIQPGESEIMITVSLSYEIR